MHAFKVRSTLSSLAAVLSGMVISLAAGSADNPRERAAMLASQAEKVLNTWSGRPETIAQAEVFIQEALALDPESGHAMVEKGRAILMAGASGRGYSPAAAKEARPYFVRATRLTPPYGRGWVLLGHLDTEMGQLMQARGALTEAEALVPDDPWLHLNWGAYYKAIGAPEKVAQQAERAIATGTTNPKALTTAYGILLKEELAKGNRARADEIYAKSAAIQRGNAWVRGNYAQDVILYFGDFDAGEKLARAALDIMDYGHARGTLSLALYGKWAQAQKDGKPLAEQEALFEAAHRNDPGGRFLPSCAMGSDRAGFVFEAAFKKGVERQSLRRC
jgi:tetratricopeptide (TPR) repeat protein